MRTDLRKKAALVFSHFTIFLYGAAALYLYVRQSQWVDGAVYESDLPAHISMAQEDGGIYSLTSLLYRLLAPLPYGTFCIALFLALCTVGAVYAAAALIRELSGERNYPEGFYELAGLIVNLVMPCYIKGFADGRYIGMQSPSVWHNSTYIAMKFPALLSLLIFIRMEKQIREKIKASDWLIFTFLLLLTTAVKPSFLVVFAPMMLVYLLRDLIKGVPFGRLFIFGCGVLPSLAVILIQNALLFGADTGNGFAVLPGQAMMQHTGYPLVVTVLSLLFPLTVLAFHIRKLTENAWYRGAWIMAGIGFLEYFLLAETGTRISDGNFLWGYSIAICALFIASLVVWLEDCLKWKEKENSLPGKVGALLAVAALIWHLYCGIYFFVNLVQGTSYWMWA
ncbi:MAG: hypothetical protein K6A92_01155 [Lachnospiraceae bacterium]|nr:hypothetical protein [Lachnospiraceae bacterium]